MNIKYWVTELSETAQTILFNYCHDKLKEYGYSNNTIDEYMADLENEKLVNLDELVSYDMMKNLSLME